MSSSSISGSEPRSPDATGDAPGDAPGVGGHPRPAVRRAVVRYTATVAVLVALAVPAFLGLVALGSGLVLNMAYDKVAIRLADKMALAAEHPGRRILAFGGSNTFFDFRGSDVEAVTGLPAINIGTHSGNGLRFLLWQAEATARPGDIVILPMEDGYYSEPGVTYYGANVSLAMGADFFWTLPFAEKLIYLRNIHVRRLLKVVAARLGLADYALESDWTFPINANGDMDAPVPPAMQVSGLIADVSGQKAKGFDFKPDTVRNIREFVARMADKNIRVVFSLPGIMENAAPDADQVAALRTELADIGADFLDLPEHGGIPAEMMFDTIYHAATPGARVYTAQVIVALCAAAARFEVTCDRTKVGAARALRQASADRVYLFAAGETLASLQPFGDGTPVTLAPGLPEAFMVASLRGCRNRIAVSATGEGTLTIRIAGKPGGELAPGGRAETATLPLPDTPGLIDIELEAAPGSPIDLAGIRRISKCRGR